MVMTEHRREHLCTSFQLFLFKTYFIHSTTGLRQKSTVLRQIRFDRSKFLTEKNKCAIIRHHNLIVSDPTGLKHKATAAGR